MWECFIVKHCFSSLNGSYLYLQLCSQATAVFQGNWNNGSWTHPCNGEFGSVSKVSGVFILFILLSLFNAEVCACTFIFVHMCVGTHWCAQHACSYFSACEHHDMWALPSSHLITTQSECKCLNPFHFHIFLLCIKIMNWILNCVGDTEHCINVLIVCCL